MVKTFTVTYVDTDTAELETANISGDVVTTKPYGVFIRNVGTNVERFFSEKIWRQVEMGNYESSKIINSKFKVIIDNKQYFVSSVEFDLVGTLTLSIFSEIKYDTATVKDNHWVLIKAPGTFEFLQTSKL